MTADRTSKGAAEGAGGRSSAPDARTRPAAAARSSASLPHGAPRRLVLASAVALALAPCAQAQEAHLNGLGWITAQPGSVIDDQTRVIVDGNQGNAPVKASGGKVGVVGNLAGRVQLISVAQANSAGLGAVDARSVWLTVLRNQLTGSVESVGGAATANVALVSGGAARHPIEASRIDVLDNRAGNVKTIGGEGDVLLGAVGSFQLPGRASANSVLLSEIDARNFNAIVNGNVADQVLSVGGSALANAVTMARSKIDGASVVLDNNRAQRVTAGGGTVNVGAGLIASADLTGVSLANSVAVAQSTLRGSALTLANNQADQVDSLGGSAFANSLNVVDSNGASVSARLLDNRASQVRADGGQGSLLAGALAEVDKSATALANSISVASPAAGSTHDHLLVGNQADRVQARGGGAAANSVWVQRSTLRGSNATLQGNQASDVIVSGLSGSVGAGVVGAFEKQGRALANSVVVDEGADLANAPTTLSGNEATGVRGMGGLAAANGLLVSGAARLSAAPVTLQDNHAQDVSATGFSGSVGAGLIASVAQKSMALANSLAVFASDVVSAVTMAGNRVVALVSNGGTAQANSASIERGEGRAARLAGSVTITDNQANKVTSGARSSAGPASFFSSAMEARAAANALVLKDGATLDAGATLQITGNQASNLQAVGGTVLVNTLAAYRGATVAAPVLLHRNVAQDISAGGGASQVAGVGSNRNGVVAVNGLYLDGGDGGAVALRGTPTLVEGNTAGHINANGGRINANALAINGQGSVSGGSFVAQGNTAERVSSQGSEGTVLGHALIDRGVGHANANALQALGAVSDSTVALLGNQATGVQADKGLAAANSVVVDQGGRVAHSAVSVVGNQAEGSQVGGGKTALANSVLVEGHVDGGSVTVGANTNDKASSGGDDAQANSVRVRDGASQDGVAATVLGNRATVAGGGSANGIDNAGRVGQAGVTIAANHATVNGGGKANSVVLDRSGSLHGGRISILGNHASLQGGGTANSVRNRGAIAASNITILGNQAQGNGGVINSVTNRGRIDGANILIAANEGQTTGGGLVNSVDNRGQLSGRVSIMGNRGQALGGGTVNSVVNHGVMTGEVMIAGNMGSVTAGGTANSVINRGVITGKIAIVGNAAVAGPGMTSNSVIAAGGAIVGAASVTAGVPAAANPGYNVTLPSTGVISHSVTVLPGTNVTNM